MPAFKYRTECFIVFERGHNPLLRVFSAGARKFPTGGPPNDYAAFPSPVTVNLEGLVYDRRFCRLS